MKKIITGLLVIFFSTVVFAKNETEKNFFEKVKDKASALYDEYKDNKYVKYGVITAGGVIGTSSVFMLGYKTCERKNRVGSGDVE